MEPEYEYRTAAVANASRGAGSVSRLRRWVFALTRFIWKTYLLERKVELEPWDGGVYIWRMNEPAGVAAHAGALLSPMAARKRGPVQPVWEPANRRLSKMDSIRAGAFLILYLGLYFAAGYAVQAAVEWAWSGIFG